MVPKKSSQQWEHLTLLEQNFCHLGKSLEWIISHTKSPMKKSRLEGGVGTALLSFRLYSHSRDIFTDDHLITPWRAKERVFKDLDQLTSTIQSTSLLENYCTGPIHRQGPEQANLRSQKTDCLVPSVRLGSWAENGERLSMCTEWWERSKISSDGCTTLSLYDKLLNCML